MTQLSQECLQDLFNRQVRLSGESAARMIFAQHYPYAAKYITPEALLAAIPVKKKKPLLVYTSAPASVPVEATQGVAPTAQPAAKTTGTKLERAKALYKVATDRSRPALIVLFVKELGMTPMGASTYASNVKKC